MQAQTETQVASFLGCPSCGAKNRVPKQRLAERPVCGRCKTPLVPRAPVTVTDAAWADEIDASPLPVLVDFWAPWCGPCRTMAPVLDELAVESAGKLKVVKLNVDENPRAAARFGVQAIPTLVLLDGGRKLDEIRGAVPKTTLRSRLAAALKL
jgi:thioredoxin 2